MQTFSSHHTPCFPTADVTLLILYTGSSHCTTFSVFCRCDPSGSAHFFYSHCRCEIPDNVDFLLQPHTLSSYSRCSFSDTVYLLLTLYCTTFSSDCKDFSWYQCHIPHTAGFLLSPHTLSSTIDVPFLYCTLSPILNNLLFILQMRPSWY